MAEAASIRNGLFHAARYTERDAFADSLIRTRTFTERLIAKLLGWPDEQLWVWRDVTGHVKTSHFGPGQNQPP